MNEETAQTIVDSLTEKEQEQLQAFLIRKKDYLWIAKRLKISSVAVRNFDILRNHKHYVSDDGYGRPELRKYIISRRYVDAEWPAIDDVIIERTRQEYDKGKVDMTMARDGFYQVLYRIPRKHIDTKRKPWFRKEYDETVS